MTSDTIADDIRQFLLAGGSITKIKAGASSLPPEINGGETRAQQRARIKRTCRHMEVCCAQNRKDT